MGFRLFKADAAQVLRIVLLGIETVKGNGLVADNALTSINLGGVNPEIRQEYKRMMDYANTPMKPEAFLILEKVLFMGEIPRGDVWSSVVTHNLVMIARLQVP